MVWNPGFCGKRPENKNVIRGKAFFTVLKLIEICI
jgi:hypothetical protein